MRRAGIDGLGSTGTGARAVCESLAERTVEMVQQEAKRREAEKQARQQMVETYDEARVTRS